MARKPLARSRSCQDREEAAEARQDEGGAALGLHTVEPQVTAEVLIEFEDGPRDGCSSHAQLRPACLYTPTECMTHLAARFASASTLW